MGIGRRCANHGSINHFGPQNMARGAILCHGHRSRKTWHCEGLVRRQEGGPHVARALSGRSATGQLGKMRAPDRRRGALSGKAEACATTSATAFRSRQVLAESETALDERGQEGFSEKYQMSWTSPAPATARGVGAGKSPAALRNFPATVRAGTTAIRATAIAPIFSRQD